jgi:hypothetical protein
VAAGFAVVVAAAFGVVSAGVAAVVAGLLPAGISLNA